MRTAATGPSRKPSQGAVGVTAGDFPARARRVLDARLHQQPDQHALQRHQDRPAEHDFARHGHGQPRAHRNPQRSGLADVGRRRGGRRDQLRDQAAAHRARSKTRCSSPTTRSTRGAPASARAAARRSRGSTTASTSPARRPTASSTTPTPRRSHLSTAARLSRQRQLQAVRRVRSTSTTAATPTGARRWFRRASGGNATSGIVSGSTTSRSTSTAPISARSRSTTARSRPTTTCSTTSTRPRNTGCAAASNGMSRSNLTLRDQSYYYDAKREWKNNEIAAFNAVDRARRPRALLRRARPEPVRQQGRAAVGHEARRHGQPRSWSALEREPARLRPPGRGQLPRRLGLARQSGPRLLRPADAPAQTARIDNTALVAEDRLKLTPTLRARSAACATKRSTSTATRTDIAGASRPGFPFSKTWHPTTGRIGSTWEAMPGLTCVRPVRDRRRRRRQQPLPARRDAAARTHARAHLSKPASSNCFWERKAEWSLALFDIERKNVYRGAGRPAAQHRGQAGFERASKWPAAVRPTARVESLGELRLHARRTTRTTSSRGGSFSGNTPPNVPRHRRQRGRVVPAADLRCRSKSARRCAMSAIASTPMPTT